MKYIKSIFFFTFFFIYIVFIFPNICSKPSNFRKHPANKTKKVVFNLSSVESIVTERSVNELLKSIDYELFSNQDLLTEILNGILFGILNKKMNIKGDQCILEVQQILINNHKKFKSKLNKFFVGINNINNNTTENVIKTCFTYKKGIHQKSKADIKYEKEVRNMLFQQLKDYELFGKFKYLPDINNQIKITEKNIIMLDTKIKRHKMFNCTEVDKKVSAISDFPIASKSEIILNIFNFFVDCYSGSEAFIKKLKPRIVKNERMNISNEKVGYNLFGMLTVRYDLEFFGKYLRKDLIKKYFSNAQIAEAKVIKGINELKEKFPDPKEQQIQNKAIFQNKMEVVFNMGIALGIAARDLLFHLS